MSEWIISSSVLIRLLMPVSLVDSSFSAAALSRRDAELACDEGAIERIGEAVRGEYGRTLIGLTCQGRGSEFDVQLYIESLGEETDFIMEEQILEDTGQIRIRAKL